MNEVRENLIEKRVWPLRLEALEARGEEGAETIVGGYAAVTSETADLGAFSEELAPGCFRSALAGTPEIKLLWQHKADTPLARTANGSLELREDARGLRFEARLAPTQAGKDAFIAARTGLVDQMSFGFIVGEDEWSVRSGKPHRRILEVGELLECSLVTFPAYPQTSAAARSAELSEVRARAAAARGRLSLRARSPYGPDSEHSWFRDRLVVAAADEAREAARDSERITNISPLDWEVGPPTDRVQGTVRDAWGRLQAGLESRDVSTGDVAAFVPAGAPAYVASAFATAARARGVLPGILDRQDLPPSGMFVSAGRLTTGATVEAQTAEEQSVSETDVDDTEAKSPVAFLAGVQDLSRQAFDRCSPSFDAWLAGELGAALAATVDAQALAGTGLNGQTRGLREVAGIQTETYDDASPTPAEFWPKLLSTIAKVAGALGAPPTHVLMHPRRIAWLYGWDAARGELPFGMRAVPVASIGTAYGAGTNQDEVLVVAAGELPLYLGPAQVEVYPQVLSEHGKVRVGLTLYMAMLGDRRPEAIGHLSGTGLATPAYA